MTADRRQQIKSFFDAAMDQPQAHSTSDSPGLESPGTLGSGVLLANYELIREIGRSGRGQVWLARDQRLDLNIALKLLPVKFTQDTERVRRFRHEAQAASALNHPNILILYDQGVANGRYYIATEYIPGQPLRRLIGQAYLTVRKAVEIAGQMASALISTHHIGIIHLDIKPENVMVRADGYVKVLDFGLAKLIEPGSSGAPEVEGSAFDIRSGVERGTVCYMSPEQAQGEKLDARTDLFSLGLILYEMLAGRRPFEGATRDQVISAIQNKETPALPAHVPRQLQQIVYRALIKDRNRRYQSAKDLLIDLRSVRGSLYSASRSAKQMAVGEIAGGNGQRQNPPVAQKPIDVVAPPMEAKKTHQTSIISFLSRIGHHKFSIVIFVGLLALLLGLCIAAAGWFGWK